MRGPTRDHSADAKAQLERARRWVLWSLGLLACVTVIVPLAGLTPIDAITALQNVEDLATASLFLLATLFVARAASAGTLPPLLVRWIAPVSLVAIVLIGWAGHYLVFDGVDLSRDEQMATFDAAIFSSGRLAADIPVHWRPFADALNLMFVLPIGSHQMWVSAYLPVNALFRALVGQVADPTLASPILAALGAFCLHRIAKRLWPDSRSTPAVVLLLYLGSSQVLVTAMTAFSMTMHLALNMLWLLLFLRGSRSGHAAAVLIGFLATGIHQPLFHPLFVLPFLYLLGQQKQWKLLAFYLVSYALISIFWLSWPIWMSNLASTPLVMTDRTGPPGYFDRLYLAVGMLDFASLWLTASNLLRFIVWQHLLLLPLGILGVLGSWRADPVARALALGLVAPTVAMAVLLPWQGLGWGYRYLHPVLGNAVLLACYGWQTLERGRLNFARPMVAMSAASILLLLPLHCWMAARVGRPFAEVTREIGAIPADLVIVDTATVPYGDNLVFNPPDLDDRPIRLIAERLEAAEMSRLCKGRVIAFFEPERAQPIAAAFPAEFLVEATDNYVQLRAAAREQGCTIVD